VINSPEEEISPYFSSAFNCLIFSSDGHVGYGGYDIYLAKGESFYEPEIYNLGYPFNSTIDDTYFMICDSVGFLSSNRGEGHRILNIYSFEIGDEALFLSLLISGESLIDSRIASRFRDVRSLDLVTFRVEDYQGYEFFEPVKREKPQPGIIENDSLSGAIGRPGMVASNTGRRNSQGSLGMQGQRRANYVIPNVDDLQSGQSSQTNQVNLSNSSINQAFGRTSDIDGIPFETIYFDYNLHDLRPEAKQALSALVNQLDGKKYDQIVILAYSDNIGRETYNFDLSRGRGEAVKNYLEAGGLPGDKLKVLPRGEITKDEDHWFKRILSRKVEIIVQSEDTFEFKIARTYIIRKDNTIENIAGLLGVSVYELKSWNGLKKDSIKAGNTIRVYEKMGKKNIRYLVSEDDVSQFTENPGS